MEPLRDDDKLYFDWLLDPENRRYLESWNTAAVMNAGDEMQQGWARIVFQLLRDVYERHRVGISLQDVDEGAERDLQESKPKERPQPMTFPLAPEEMGGFV